MRLLLTTVAAAAISLAASQASAQVVEFRTPGVAVGVGNTGYDNYGPEAYDEDDAPLPRGGRSYVYENDNGCRVEITRERHWDGSVYTHRERHCD